MKKLLTLALALVALAAFSGLSAAQQKGEQKSRPEGVEMEQPATGEKETVDKASPKLMTGEVTGRVTGIDPTAKTFTVMVQGRAITFSAAKLNKLPTVEENIDITFTLKPDQLPIVTSTARSGSMRGGGLRQPVGGKCHCNHHTGSNLGPLRSLNVCTC